MAGSFETEAAPASGAAAGEGHHMAIVYEPPISHLVAAVLFLAAAHCAARSARLVARGLRRAGSLDLIRGIRVCVFALVAALFAVAVLSARPGFIVLGSLILAEEL